RYIPLLDVAIAPQHPDFVASLRPVRGTTGANPNGSCRRGNGKLDVSCAACGCRKKQSEKADHIADCGLRIADWQNLLASNPKSEIRNPQLAEVRPLTLPIPSGR